MIKSVYFHNPSAKGFERFAKWVLALGYHFVSLNQLTAYLRSEPISLPDKPLFVSLDDGWAGNLKLLPIMEKYNIPITLFVATEPLSSGNYWWEYVAREVGYSNLGKVKAGDYNDLLELLSNSKAKYTLNRSSMTIDQLVTFAAHSLVTIGSHTVTHPLLDKISEDQLNLELRESKDFLETLIGCEVCAMSYPNGNFTEREIKAVGNYYNFAFTTQSGSINKQSLHLTLNRTCLTGDVIKDVLKFIGFWQILKQIKSKLRDVF